MINLINIYKDNCYFFKYDKDGNMHPVDRYDPEDEDINFYYENEDSNYKIDNSDISIDNSGNIFFTLGDEKFIIDDGFRKTLVRAGYFYIDGYNKKRDWRFDLPDAKNRKGKEIREYLINLVNKGINKAYEVYYNEMKSKKEEPKFTFDIKVCTIDDLVKINETRKVYSQPFYPFNKDMDSYGSVFIVIYAQKNTIKANERYKFKKADYFLKLIKKFVDEEAENYDWIFYDGIKINRRIIDNGINNI